MNSMIGNRRRGILGLVPLLAAAFSGIGIGRSAVASQSALGAMQRRPIAAEPPAPEPFTLFPPFSIGMGGLAMGSGYTPARRFTGRERHYTHGIDGSGYVAEVKLAAQRKRERKAARRGA